MESEPRSGTWLTDKELSSLPWPIPDCFRLRQKSLKERINRWY